jgi:hypothetical protein
MLLPRFELARMLVPRCDGRISHNRAALADTRRDIKFGDGQKK